MKTGLFVVLTLFCASALTGVYFFSRIAVPVEIAASARPTRPAPKELRIGTVNLQQILTTLPATGSVNRIVRGRHAAAVVEYQRLLNSHKRKRAARFKKQSDQQILAERARLARTITAAIQARVEVLARQRELDLVFDASAQTLRGIPEVLSASPAFDLTDDLLNDPELLALQPE